VRGSLRHGVGRVPGSSLGGVAAPRFSETSKFVRIRPMKGRSIKASIKASVKESIKASIKASISRQASNHRQACASCPPARLATCASCHMRVLPQTSLRVLPHARLITCAPCHLGVWPPARLAPCAPCPPVQPARLARGQACAEPVSRRTGCAFLCRTSVRVRRLDGSSPTLRRGGSWRGAQDARGATCARQVTTPPSWPS
jgi:hypothetical protein